MKIKYVGPAGVRIIAPFEWNAGNGFVQEVPAEMAASLLTYPFPHFELAEGEDAAKAEAEIEEVIEPKKKNKR